MVKDRIRYFRKKIDMSQDRLAELTGLNQSDISKIEGGKRRVTTDELQSIADALGVMPSALLDNTKQKAVGE